MANRIVSVHAGICGIGIYAIMLPSSGFSVAHYLLFCLKLRTVLVENLAQTEVKSVEALQQTSAAIAMVTEHTAELDFTAQRSAASAIQSMSEFLSQQASSAATSSQKVQESARYCGFETQARWLHTLKSGKSQGRLVIW